MKVHSDRDPDHQEPDGRARAAGAEVIARRANEATAVTRLGADPRRSAPWGPRMVANLQQLEARRERSTVMVVATIGFWAAAVASWIPLYHRISGIKGLGWDLLTTWRAERLFAHGGAPYAIKAFLYPPSCLLLFRPIAALSEHDLKVVGLAATVVVAWGAVMLSASAIGLRWWGITSAVTVFVLSFTQAMTGELGLENVSVLCFLALAVFYYSSIRGQWVVGGAAIGISLAIKPLLLPVLLVFVLARQWRGLATLVAVPTALNLLALGFVASPSQVFSKLPSLLDRTGTGVGLNSAWVDVTRTLALPVGVSVTLRVATVVIVVVGTWWAWHVLDDVVLRIVTSSSLLLIGAYLAGTLSEYHFMLTLVPLAMTVVLRRSPVRTIPALLGIVWMFGHLTFPRSVLGLTSDSANNSAFRAFGMSLVLVSVVVVLARRRNASLPAAVAAGEVRDDRANEETWSK